MSMPVSERSFLERLTNLIPGVRGYRDREGRRETDRRLREYLAGRIDEARDALNEIRVALGCAATLDRLDEVGRLERILQKCAASLRLADQGYSGFFDPVRFGETELERIYAYDESLLDTVQALGDRVNGAAVHGISDAGTMQEILRVARELDRAIGRRREVFQTPARG